MKRSVKFLEDVLIGERQHEEGDIATFPKDEADQYISLGWCECLESGEKGERKPGAAPINVQSVVQPAT